MNESRPSGLVSPQVGRRSNLTRCSYIISFYDKRDSIPHFGNCPPYNLALPAATGHGHEEEGAALRWLSCQEDSRHSMVVALSIG